MHAKSSIAALNILDALAQSQFQRIMLRAFAVILERLSAGGLLRRTRKWKIPDFEQFRRREEDHIDRIVVERIAQAAFVDHQRAQARAFRLDGASQACRARSDANQIKGVHESSLPCEVRICNRPERRPFIGCSRSCNQIFTFCGYNRRLMRG